MHAHNHAVVRAACPTISYPARRLVRLLCCLLPPSQKLESDVARWQEEIPADQAAAESLAQQLEEAEAKLEQLQDGIKEEVEGYHQQMSKASRDGPAQLASPADVSMCC